MARVLCFFIVATLVTTDAAPQGYTRVEMAGGYLKLYRELLNWNSAVDRCASDGGFLYTPNSELELEQVIRLLGVNTVYMHTGLSDVDSLGVYMTVDGKPISQVFNKWMEGEPIRGSNNEYRCAQIHVKSRRLGVYSCTGDSQTFICKIEQGIESFIMKDIKMTIGNSSDRVIGLLERQNTALEQLSQGITNQASAAARRTETAQRQVAASYRLMEKLQQQSENQTTLLATLAESAARQSPVLERLAESAARQSPVLERLAESAAKQSPVLDRLAESAAKQSPVLERLAESAAKQSTVLDRLAESAGAQNTVLGLLLDAAKNQTTIMTQMLERLQEEDNNSVNVRSEQ